MQKYHDLPLKRVHWRDLVLARLGRRPVIFQNTFVQGGCDLILPIKNPVCIHTNG